MQENLSAYLFALRSQLVSAAPSERLGEMASKKALYTERVLNYLAVQSRDLGAFQESFLDAIKSLAPQLGEYSAQHPDASQRVQSVLNVERKPEVAWPALQELVRELNRDGSAAAKGLLAQIGALDLKLQADLNAAVEQACASPVPSAAPDEGLTPEQKEKLTDLLLLRFPRDKELAIGEVKAIPGGFSKRTVFLKLDQAGSLPGQVVLRIDKPDSPVGTTVVDEFEIIQAMHEAGVPVPRPLLLEPDPAILGSPFVLVERVEGDAAGDAFEVKDPQRSFGVSLARGLASMHQVPTHSVSESIPGQGIDAEQRMLSDIDHFENAWRATGITSLALEMAYGWLRENISLASSGRRAIVHRDVGCHNLLAKDGLLTAILDWETALIGDPAQDIAYVWHTATQTMPWEEFLAEYVAAGGHRPDPGQMEFYRIWRHVWLMSMQLQAKSAIEAGYTQDIGLIYNVLNLFQRLTVSLQELLSEIAQRET